MWVSVGLFSEYASHQTDPLKAKSRTGKVELKRKASFKFVAQLNYDPKASSDEIGQ